MLWRSIQFTSNCETHRKYDIDNSVLLSRFGQHKLGKTKPWVWRKASSSMSSKNTDT